MARKIIKRLLIGLSFIICHLSFSMMLTSCSDSDDPFFTAGENDTPRILNTDIPEGSVGEPGVIKNIVRTENFTFEVMVTPVHYTTVTWFIDDEQVAEGLSIDVPVLAGDHILKIVAKTTKGLETSRTCLLIVQPAEGDPDMAGDNKSRWLTIGTTKTVECKNVTSVSKVFIGKTEATNVSYANGKLTFDVPSMDEGDYSLTIETDGVRYGCGYFHVSADAYVDPGIKETVLWEGGVDINWGDSNVKITTDQMAAVPVGATIRLVYEIFEAEYHAMRITTPWWGDNPEDQVVAQFDLPTEAPFTYEFVYTEANKAIVDAREGMLIVGFGYKLTKVIVVEGVAPIETALWEGDVNVNWGESNVKITTDQMAAVPVGAKINVYYEMVDMPDNYHALRITTPWWGDNPEDQVVAQFDLKTDTPNPYQFTYSEANKTIVDAREGMLLVGYGYKLTRVTFSK